MKRRGEPLADPAEGRRAWSPARRVRTHRRASVVAAGTALAALAAVCPAAFAATGSPEALREEAMRLFEKARAATEGRREAFQLAEEKVAEAIGVLDARPRLTKSEEDLRVDLTSLLYWIRKMTPLALPPPLPPPPPPRPKTDPKTDPPPAPKPKRAPRDKRRPPRKPKKPSGSLGELPARLEPIARTIREKYQRGYESHAAVKKMMYDFYLRDFRQAYMLRKYPKRALEGAALAFQAVDECELSFIGGTTLIVRMQACLELDRLYNTKPGKEYSYAVHRHLKNAFWNLAICGLDFQPAVEYFEALDRGKITHPDVKLGLALAKLGQSYVVSQARVGQSKLRRMGREDIGPWFGPACLKLWNDAWRKYNWPKEKLVALSEDSRRLFKEYAAEESRGYIYEALSETFWLWYFLDAAGFNRKAAEVFERVDPATCTDAEKTILRSIVTTWMRQNRHVDSGKVKWKE